MWNTKDIRVLCDSPGQAAYRRLLKYSAWLIYGIAWCCHFFKLRYDSQNKRLEYTKYNLIISKLVLTIKWLLLLRQLPHYVVFMFIIWGVLFRVDQSAGQDLILGLAMEVIAVYVLRRIVIFLHSQEDRRLMQQLVNEIIYIAHTIQTKFGMIYQCEWSLLGLYLLKMYLVYLLLDSMWYKPYFLWINFLYWLLSEYCCFVYFIYQLILLNWFRNFVFLLQSFIRFHEQQKLISLRYHRRLMKLFRLYLRINKLHKFVREKVAWLPSANYLAIFTSIFSMELLLECIVYAHDDIQNKIYIIADGCLSPALVPLLNVFIHGLCTDRLRSEELTLQQEIFIINILYFKKHYQLNNRLQVFYNEHTSLIVYQKLEPIHNIIILDITCDRRFAFDYFLTIIITALSFLQYTISSNRDAIECVTRK